MRGYYGFIGIGRIGVGVFGIWSIIKYCIVGIRVMDLTLGIRI